MLPGFVLHDVHQMRLRRRDRQAQRELDVYGHRRRPDCGSLIVFIACGFLCPWCNPAFDANAEVLKTEADPSEEKVTAHA
jgi:hypothetical protein